ncbi:MAG: succinylglutamate desuccinylase/aspartoacylase family protein, partial [Bacteroidota bacterium]|nr:succinylglutamate desuccinylase/aspartoacylase family protein [Bacteroidota bacterium]
MISEDFHIEERVQPGESRHFNIHIARLPIGTVVDIRVFVYRGTDPGPVILLSAGLHGDEVNGTEIIRRMMSDHMLQPDAGTVIAMPVLNIYGFLNFARDLPDGKDANRSFPGTKTGSLASRVAYHLGRKIIPNIDFGIDFHTGGGNR